MRKGWVVVNAEGEHLEACRPRWVGEVEGSFYATLGEGEKCLEDFPEAAEAGTLRHVRIVDVRVHRADALVPEESVPYLRIVAGERFTSEGGQSNRARFEHDAEAIASGLRRCLPGGTFDALVATLLRMKLRDLTVPADESEISPTETP